MINICNGFNKNGEKCKNKIKNNNFCWRHNKYKKCVIKSYSKFSSMPNEIYMIIYEYLDFNDKINFSRINRNLYIIFKNIIQNTNIKILCNKNIKSSNYIMKYLENNKIYVFMNLNYNNNYYKGLDEIDYRMIYQKKEIVIYKNHIYENNNNKNINFGFETKKLKCIDDEINTISDLLKKFKIKL